MLHFGYSAQTIIRSPISLVLIYVRFIHEIFKTFFGSTIVMAMLTVECNEYKFQLTKSLILDLFCRVLIGIYHNLKMIFFLLFYSCDLI